MYYRVALRKESVDRNAVINCTDSKQAPVALRKESVDRNVQSSPVTCKRFMSLSARRAWIEMIQDC